jgi:signal transduction histidine kinase
MNRLEQQSSAISTRATSKLGVRGRLLLAFFGISAFAVLGAALGHYAFQQVGGRIERIDARVPQVVSSMEISRAVDRLIASAPVLLGASTSKERDEALKSMRPELDRLIISLNELARGGTVSDAAATIQTLVGALRSNLVELGELVDSRIKTKVRLAELLQALLQIGKDADRMFAPWFDVMEMRITRAIEDSRKGDGPAGMPSDLDLAGAIVLDRAAQTAHRGLSALIDQLVRASTIERKSRLPVVEFQLRRSLDDLQARAKDLDPKLRVIFTEQLDQIRKLAIGPNAAMVIRSQELELIGKAEQLIVENTDLSVRLTAAVDRLVSEAESDIGASAKDALSVQRLSAQTLLSFAVLSLLSSTLIVWLYVGRNIIGRLMLLNTGMLAISRGGDQSPIEIRGRDEIAEMGQVAEVLRKNTLERDELLVEKEHVAERLEQQVRERTGELAQSVEELRALGVVSHAVNSSIDLETVLATIVMKATELSGADAGTIYVLDEKHEVFRPRATHGLDDKIIREINDHPIRIGETLVGRAAEQRQSIQVSDVQEDQTSVLNVIVRAGFRSVLVVPLIGNDNVIGALVVRRKRIGEFAKGTVELLQTFAAQSVLAMENARLFDRAETRARELAESLDELHATQDRLVQTEKLASLGQLTAGIAHEIKNPLNFVNNFASLSAELTDELGDALTQATLVGQIRSEVDELTSLLKGNLNKIVQHGRRADAIVKNMLLHSRESSGERQSTGINALVEESLNLAYHGARAEKADFSVSLTRDFDPDAGTLDVYPHEINRALINLFSNGFYAATKRKLEGGDGTFEPVLGTATRNLGKAIEIRVRDNGIGILPDVREKMFNPFFTTKPTGEGTGLGLSMTHDIIVKQHGGTIDVETRPGEFTEIIITLPRDGRTADGGKPQ